MQNNQRILLFAALAVLIYLIYSKWVEVNRVDVTPIQQELSVDSMEASLPEAVSDMSSQNITQSVEGGAVNNRYITVETDNHHLKIDLKSGDIVQLGLPTYPKSLEDEEPYLLMAQSSERYLINQTGLIGASGLEQTPNHLNSRFVAQKEHYIMDDGSDTLVVPLIYDNPETGYRLEKRYTFTRDSFRVGFEQIFTNNSDNTWSGKQYIQFISQENQQKRSGIGASSYQGTVYSLPLDNNKRKLTNYSKIKFKNMGGPRNQGNRYEGIGGWTAYIEQYFLIAHTLGFDRKSAAEEQNIVETSALDGGKYLTRLLDQQMTVVPPGESHVFNAQFFLGPKIKSELEATAKDLDLTLDYGWFSYISKIMFWILEFYHKFVGNWGWSIILLTITVKAALFWFASKGYVSMARMRNVGPKLQIIRERYADDRQKLSEEMMKLYRREKINPLGGCLPILIQIPIFIALFWMLMESVELRQAPWILWIEDLSQRDPYFILPLIMGVTMFFQQRLNPAPPDPTQATIIKWMPVVFTFMFMWFAAGIVLYWVTNNLLTILQQSYIMRKVEREESKR